MKNAAREIASSEDILYFFLCLLDGAHTIPAAALFLLSLFTKFST